MRWIATPSAAPATHAHGAATLGSAADSVTSDGSSPKLTMNGSTEIGVDLRPALYAHAEASAIRCASAICRLSTHESASETTTAPDAAIHAARNDTSPRASGLSARPVARSRGASIASFEMPTDS